VLEDIVTTKVGQVKRAGPGIVGARPDSLSEKKESIAFLDVETSEHSIGKLFQIDVLPVMRKVAMVGQCVEAGAGTTSFIQKLDIGNKEIIYTRKAF
jgi:hypothetical protein